MLYEVITYQTAVISNATDNLQNALTNQFKIAEVAGVNEVTLFRRYGSKAGLFEKVIEHQLADTPLSKLVYTGDLEADLLAIVEAYSYNFV